MESIVRNYRGRHKVEVVRNTANQYITGQWNIVSKLATGKWLGMFCADDIAHRDRVSVAAKLIQLHPTLLGLCTSFEENYIDDSLTKYKLKHNGMYILEDYSIDISTTRTPIVGATSWWNIKLFKQSLPFAPLDDLLIRWIIHSNSKGIAEPTWLFDGDIQTVEYGIGSGITSENNVHIQEESDYVNGWLARTKSMKKFANLEAKTYNAIATYMDMIGDYSISNLANKRAIMAEIYKGNTVTRLTLIKQSFRYGISKYWLKFFIRELLGLRATAYISKIIHNN